MVIKIFQNYYKKLSLVSEHKMLEQFYVSIMMNENHRDRNNHSLFLPLKEEFGQYDLYLYCSILALSANNEIDH